MRGEKKVVVAKTWIPLEGVIRKGRVIILKRGYHQKLWHHPSPHRQPSPVTSLQSFSSKGMEQIINMYIDSEGSPVFETGVSSDHLVRTIPPEGKSMVNIYYNPNTGLPEFETGEGNLVYSNPKQGLKKISNIYYNPNTRLPQFSVET